MVQLTERQAFEAMVLFLEEFYARTHSDDVAALLGSMLFLPGATTADPAMWQDWMQAVQKILKMEETDAQLRFTWPGNGSSS